MGGGGVVRVEKPHNTLYREALPEVQLFFTLLSTFLTEKLPISHTLNLEMVYLSHAFVTGPTSVFE